MLHTVIQRSKTTKNIVTFILMFFFFLSLYIFLDFEGNTNYFVMTQNFSLSIVITHIVINIVIAILTSIMVLFSVINYRLYKVEPKGSNAIPFLTFIFGLLTFGCTGCVVAFFSAVGIAFTPIILPHGNMLWKLLALALVIGGFIWIMYSIEHTTCKIQKGQPNE